MKIDIQSIVEEALEQREHDLLNAIVERIEEQIDVDLIAEMLTDEDKISDIIIEVAANMIDF
ncbi:MAG: hypothetical protein ACI3V2_03300 [Faecousia sp.]